VLLDLPGETPEIVVRDPAPIVVEENGPNAR
jgi:hypothetical protein